MDDDDSSSEEQANRPGNEEQEADENEAEGTLYPDTSIELHVQRGREGK